MKGENEKPGSYHLSKSNTQGRKDAFKRRYNGG
jgi:hypothetical protein